MKYYLREISNHDNGEIARIIRQVLAEFGADKPGFAWQDPELDRMTQTYAQGGCVYYVAVMNEQIVGGAGIAPFDCGVPGTCELQKMYLQSHARGKGLGMALMELLLRNAQELGYVQCYLETLESMAGAAALYRRSGFVPLDKPLGKSGHSGCNQWYLRQLQCREGVSETILPGNSFLKLFVPI